MYFFKISIEFNCLNFGFLKSVFINAFTVSLLIYTQSSLSPGPPASPPQVTVEGETQTYQGVDLSNTVTLAEGYTGDVICRVEGGYPDAHNTQLKCGNLEGSAGGKTSTLSFTADSLTKDMDGTVCTCTSQHDSGCYSNRETRLTLNVVCK